MSSDERPIGAAKGKQPNTEALCPPPPPPQPPPAGPGAPGPFICLPASNATVGASSLTSRFLGPNICPLSLVLHSLFLGLTDLINDLHELFRDQVLRPDVRASLPSSRPLRSNSVEC